MSRLLLGRSLCDEVDRLGRHGDDEQRVDKRILVAGLLRSLCDKLTRVLHGREVLRLLVYGMLRGQLGVLHRGLHRLAGLLQVWAGRLSRLNDERLSLCRGAVHGGQFFSQVFSPRPYALVTKCQEHAAAA